MKKDYHNRLPADWKTIREIDENRKPRLAFKKTVPKRYAVDHPTRRELEKRKQKITLPTINFPADDPE